MKFFKKDDNVFALLNSGSRVDLFFPVQAKVTDIIKHKGVVKNELEITKLYDSSEFLEQVWDDLYFNYLSSNNKIMNVLNKNVINDRTITQFMDSFKKYKIINESVLCFETYEEMKETYDFVNNYYEQKLTSQLEFVKKRKKTL